MVWVSSMTRMPLRGGVSGEVIPSPYISQPISAAGFSDAEYGSTTTRHLEAAVRKKLRTVPKFQSEAEERRFWEKHDSSDYVDWSKAKRMRFPNLKPSTMSISLRLPVALLDRIKVAANKRDVPYQSLIKMWLAEKTDEQATSR